jgi:hypothetical protein
VSSGSEDSAARLAEVLTRVAAAGKPES